MDSITALIFTVGGIVGSILVTQMWQMNYFKRENFKINKSSVLAENRLKMEKLRKEMGLSKSSKTENTHETGGVLDLVKGLDVNKLLDIADIIKGGGEENIIDVDAEPKSELSSLIDKLPPSVIEGFLSKLGDNKKGEGGEGGY